MRWRGLARFLGKARYSSSIEAEQIDFSKIIQDSERETETPHMWIEKMKSQLESAKHCLYSPDKKPFPHNPSFIFHVPLDDFTRSQIYYLYKNRPKEWTIRKLAKKFHISVSRVDAVIDLKEHEENLLRHQFKRNETYVSTMESIVGANGQQAREVVKEICDVWKKRSPMFIRLPEDQNLSFQEAAKLLGLTHKFYHFDPDQDVPKMAEPQATEEAKVIQIDPEETNRKWKFFITDISKDKHPSAVASSAFDTQHQDLIHDIQPDFCGKRLATCSSDNSVRIFAVDGDSQRLIQVLKDHSAPVWQVAWSHPQFDNILASCSYDGSVFLWKEVNGSWTRFKEHREHKASVNSISFAPAELGLHLACGSSDGRVSVLSYKDQGEWEVKFFSAHVSGVNTLCWASTAVPNVPLAKRIITGGSDNSIKVWTPSAETGDWVEECGSLEGHSDWVRDVAWCPNETLPFLLFASGSQDKTVLLWTSADNGKSWTKHPLCSPFSDPVWKLSWSVAGNLLAVSYGENKTSVWRQNIDNTWEKIQQLEDGKEIALQ